MHVREEEGRGRGEGDWIKRGEIERRRKEESVEERGIGKKGKTEKEGGRERMIARYVHVH